jgi:hypothetical protein
LFKPFPFKKSDSSRAPLDMKIDEPSLRNPGHHQCTVQAGEKEPSASMKPTDGKERDVIQQRPSRWDEQAVVIREGPSCTESPPGNVSIMDYCSVDPDGKNH